MFVLVIVTKLKDFYKL